MSSAAPTAASSNKPEKKESGFHGAGDAEALRLAEIKNGRAAMMAITGFAVQEFLWGSPVIQQTPFFFGR